MELHHSDPMCREFEAVVTALHPDGAIELDKTAFYARSGGQAGDIGHVGHVAITDTRYAADGQAVLHRTDPAGLATLMVGESVVGRIDWERRHRLMRLHSAQHLLALAALEIHPTASLAGGGDISPERARVDVAWPADGPVFGTEHVIERVNQLVDGDVAIRRFADPDRDRFWWWEIEGFDPLPCGGTHVIRTGEIGAIVIAAKRKGSKAVRLSVELSG